MYFCHICSSLPTFPSSVCLLAYHTILCQKQIKPNKYKTERKVTLVTIYYPSKCWVCDLPLEQRIPIKVYMVSLLFQYLTLATGKHINISVLLPKLYFFNYLSPFIVVSGAQLLLLCGWSKVYNTRGWTASDSSLYRQMTGKAMDRFTFKQLTQLIIFRDLIMKTGVLVYFFK